MNSREQSIDVMKGIAIYLVVLGHLCHGYSPVATKLINVCHMPAFFFISGLFFARSVDKRPGVKFVVEKVRTLLIPFLIWSGVAFLFSILSMLFVQGNANQIFGEFIEIFVKARSVWFLLVLFLTFIVTWGIKAVTKNKQGFWIVSLLICLVAFFACNTEVFRIYKFRWLYPFFLLGILVSEKEYYFDRLVKMKERKLPFQMCVALFVMGTYYACISFGLTEEAFYEFQGAQWKFEQVGVYIFCILLGLLGTMGILEVSVLISKMSMVQNVLGIVGQYSIDIYVIHMFMVKMMTILFDRVSQDSMLLSIVAFMIYSVIIVALIMALDMLILRKSKWFRTSIGMRA